MPRYVVLVLCPVGAEDVVEEDRRAQEGGPFGPQNIIAGNPRQTAGESFG